MSADVLNGLLGCGCRSRCCCAGRGGPELEALEPGSDDRSVRLPRFVPPPPAFPEESPFVPALPLAFAPLPNYGAWAIMKTGLTSRFHGLQPFVQAFLYGRVASRLPPGTKDVLDAAAVKYPEGTPLMENRLASTTCDEGTLELFSVADVDIPFYGHFVLRLWHPLALTAQILDVVPVPDAVDASDVPTATHDIPDPGLWIGTRVGSIHAFRTVIGQEQRPNGTIRQYAYTYTVTASRAGLDVAVRSSAPTSPWPLPEPGGDPLPSVGSAYTNGWLDDAPAMIVDYNTAPGGPLRQGLLVGTLAGDWSTIAISEPKSDPFRVSEVGDAPFHIQDPPQAYPWIEEFVSQPAIQQAVGVTVPKKVAVDAAASSVRIPVAPPQPLRTADMVTLNGYALRVEGVTVDAADLSTPGGWPSEIPAGTYTGVRQRPAERRTTTGIREVTLSLSNVVQRVTPLTVNGWGNAPLHTNPDVRNAALTRGRRAVRDTPLILTFPPLGGTAPAFRHPVLVITYRTREDITFDFTCGPLAFALQLPASGRGFRQERLSLGFPDDFTAGFTMTLTTHSPVAFTVSSIVIDALRPTGGL